MRESVVESGGAKARKELGVVRERFALVEGGNVIGHLGRGPDQYEVITEKASSPADLGRADGPVSAPSSLSNTIISDDARFSDEWARSRGRRDGG